jgi:hypothetical protein
MTDDRDGFTQIPEEEPATVTPAPPVSAVATSGEPDARRFVVVALATIVVMISLAIAGAVLIASNESPTATTVAAASPSASATSASPAAPGATANPIGSPVAAQVYTPTPAGNYELDGTIVDAIRTSATLATPPAFAGEAPLLAIVDDLPDGGSAALIQRFPTDDEFTYVIRYYLMTSATAARDLARLEAGVPTQYEGAQTVDDRDIDGGACVTVSVLEEMVSHCYVLRGRVAVIVEILGPAVARDHIIDAGVALSGYGREIVVRAITD